MVSFPDPLQVKVEFALGADPAGNPVDFSWFEVPNEDVDLESGISGDNGGQDEEAQIPSSAVALTLRNPLGHYTPNNPTSPHYPNFHIGMPARVTAILPDGSDEYILLQDFFNRTLGNAWGKADIGDTWLDETSTTVLDVPSTNGTAGLLNLSNTSSTQQMTQKVGFLDGDILTKVSGNEVAVGNFWRVTTSYRESGIYQFQIRFLTSGAMELHFFRDGNTVGSTALATTYSANTQFWMRVRAAGTSHKARVWQDGSAEPSTWDLEVTDTTDEGGTPGLISLWADRDGTNTGLIISYHEVTVTSPIDPIITGIVTELQPEWPEGDLSDENVDLENLGTDDPGYAVVRVKIEGPSAAIFRGEQPVLSPIRRKIPRLTRIVGYWPMEDEEGASLFASGLSEQVAGAKIGTDVDLARNDFWGGSKPLPSFPAASSGWYAPVKMSYTPDQWRVDGLFYIGGNSPGNSTIMDIFVDIATVRWFRIYITSGNLVAVRGYSSSRAILATPTSSFSPLELIGKPIKFAIRCFLSGGNMAVNVTLTQSSKIAGTAVVAENFTATDAAWASATVGRVTRVGVENLGTNQPERTWGHIVVTAGSANPFPSNVDRGSISETAGDRFLRLCDEEGIRGVVYGSNHNSAIMGPQRIEPLSTLFEDIAATDGGRLYELKNSIGFGYRTRYSMLNQQPVLTLDASPHGREPDILLPFSPITDFSGRVNSAVVHREGGETASLENENEFGRTGKLERQLTIYSAADSVNQDVAEFEIVRGTWPGMRYKNVTPAVAQKLEILAQWHKLNGGERIRVQNLPPQHFPRTAELLFLGRSFGIAPNDWGEVGNTELYSPYEPGLLGGLGDGSETYPRRYAAHKSFLATSVTDSGTSLSVFTAPNLGNNVNPGFERGIDTSTTNTEFDFYLVGGTLVRSQLHVFKDWWAGLFTPDGATNLPYLQVRRPVIQGLDYLASAWVYSPVGGFDVRIGLETEIATTVASFFSTPVTLAADTWTRLTHTVSASSFVGIPWVKGKVQINESPPLATNLLWVDEFEIGNLSRPWVDSTANSAEFPFNIIIGGEVMTVTAATSMSSIGIQTFTVTRGVNGIARAHSAGADVQLEKPLRYALDWPNQ